MGKDPNAPKRPMSSYMLFCNSKRAAVTKKNPSLKMTEIAPILAKMWKAISPSEKKKFDAQAAKAKKEYAVKLRKYQETPEYAAFKDTGKELALLKKVCKKHGLKHRGKKVKFPKDENAPKRAASGFFLFSNDNRSKMMKKYNNSVSLAGKALGESWKNMGASAKSKYEAMAAKQKTAYAKKLATYQKSANYKKYTAARAEFNKMKKKL